MPAWLVQWGHPAMMGFIVLGMGMPGAAVGWAGRLNSDRRKGEQQKQAHDNIMLPFVILVALGGCGGTLSMAMQGYDVWQSAHAKSAGAILVTLVGSTVHAYTGFSLGMDASPKARLTGRKVHAYVDTAAMSLFLVHAYLGIKILLE
jgi:Protein of unknown function (DUF4079)